MEKIAELLSGRRTSRIQQPRRQAPSGGLKAEPGSYIMSNDPEAAAFNPPDPVPCEYCGAPRYTTGYVFDEWTIKWNPIAPEPCMCPEAVAAREAEKARLTAAAKAAREAEEARKMQERVRRLVGDSGMNARFLQRTFGSYTQTEENQAAFKVCKQYADTFRDKQPQYNPTPGRNGLFITGPMGTGKTHLAAAIANQLMQEGTPVICMTMIDLLERIKRTYEQRRQEGEDESEGDILDTYKTVPLLVIDDMGKEPATDWAVSKIYAIVNARYEAYMPIIVTTNYGTDELVRRLTLRDGDQITAATTVDRLKEMCVGIVTTGESWRSK